jgi:glycosyltransferase involved in cell wall biosynthesis
VGSRRQRRSIALVTAPALIEEWLEPLGLSVASFRDEMSSGWMFNYVDALSGVGIDTVVVCFSEWVKQPRRWEHAATGATLWILPAPRRIATLRRWMAEPRLAGARDPASLASGLRRHLAPYGLTPLSALRRVLRQERCDAILSQDYDSQRFDACVLLGRLLRIPVFATFQGGFFPPSRPGEIIRPLTIRGCDGLIVPARRELERVQRRFGIPDAKLAHIPNPLNTEVWRPAARSDTRKALGIPAGARVAVTHGRIDINDKGLDVLLGAWTDVRAERTQRDVRLLIIGSGDDTADVQRMIATGDFQGAQLVDHFVLDPDLIRRYLSAADVYAFAGRYEGFPVAVVEAMACGLPVVATEASGIPDLFPAGEGSGGLVVPLDDSAALAEGLGRCLDDPDFARELGGRARRRVEDHCSLEAVGRLLADFMRNRGLRSP